jgi:chaperonin GroEL
MQIVAAVRPTLGPGARVVAFSPEFGGAEPDLYDNGGEIARRILQIRGRDEDVGAMLIRDLLWRLQNQVGDGTATAAVLFGSVYSEGIRYLTAGGNARRLQTYLEAGLEIMLAELTAMTHTLSGKEKLAQLAESISHDPELSRYLGEIFDIIGAHGRLEIRKGRSREIEREYVEGMYWERGLMSREMITDWEKARTTFENAAILISDLEIHEPQALFPVLELALRNEIKSLFIVAGKLSEATIGFLLANRKPERFQVAAVTTPEYGKDLQAAALQDMAALTGGKAFLKATGETFAHIRLEDFGQARRAWADLRNFGLIGGKGDPKTLRRHIHNLQKAYEHTDDPVPKGKWLKRLGKLMGGSATLWVGADTEMDMERRVELATHTAAAMRLAMEEGVLPGAGVALLECRQALRKRLAGAQETDERAAYEILIKAVETPIRTIIANAGYDASDVMADLRLAGPGHGLDVVKEKIVNIQESGIYDPAGVVKAALFGAIKTAALALTVDVVVHHAQPEQAKPLGPTARMKL